MLLRNSVNLFFNFLNDLSYDIMHGDKKKLCNVKIVSNAHINYIYSIIYSAVNEVETSLKKEIVIGGSTILTPKSYMKAVAGMDPTSANVFDTDVSVQSNGESSRHI